MVSVRNGRQPEGERADDFESSFRKLQEVVRLLSEGNLTLQESLAAFEEGMSLAERCSAMLEQAELRVKEVSERARRAGSAAAAGMAEPLDVGAGLDEPGLIEVEVERTVVIESAAPNAFSEPFDEMPPANPQRGARGAGGLGRFDSVLDELDPLFDEDD